MTYCVVSLRRYPVKSMGGESLAVAHFEARGLRGDRAFAVRDDDGRLASGKNTKRLVRRDGIFGYSARTDGRSVVVSDSFGTLGIAGQPAVDSALSAALGAKVRVTREADRPHFDDGSVSLIGTATLQWCAREFGTDANPRRLRVNLVVETAEPFEEESWVGSTIGVGAVRLTVTQRIVRCRTIDLAQDGVPGPTRWLKQLGQQRDLRLAVYCDVAAAGPVSVGDAVTVPDQES